MTFLSLSVIDADSQISWHIHRCSTFPSRASASDLTLCWNPCHQPRLSPSEMCIFLRSWTTDQLIQFYAIKSQGLVINLQFYCNPKLLYEKAVLRCTEGRYSSVPIILPQLAHYTQLYVTACLGRSKKLHSFTRLSILALFLHSWSKKINSFTLLSILALFLQGCNRGNSCLCM